MVTLRALAIPVLAAAAALPGIASASSFYFYGNCDDCAAAAGTPTFPISGELVLSGYTEGDPVQTGNFVLFSYSGSNLLDPFIVSATGDQSPDSPPWVHALFSAAGTITVGGVQELELKFGDGLEFTLENGTWFTCGRKGDVYYGVPCSFQVAADYGSGSFTNTVIPLPAPVLLLASGLLGLAGFARRDRQG